MQDLIALPGGRMILSRGKYSMIAMSTDGGRTWQTVLGSDGRGGYQLQFVTPTDGWAFSLGALYHTVDGGLHWTNLVCDARLGPCANG